MSARRSHGTGGGKHLKSGPSPRGTRRPSRSRDGQTFSSQLSETLNFIDVSIDAVAQAIKSEMPDWKMSDMLWYHVLVKQPHNDFRFLGNRALSYWIQIFNRWQELSGWNPQRQREHLDACDLPAVMDMNPPECFRCVINLFDPAGAKMVAQEGTSTRTLHKVSVNMYELMFAGVLLSRQISTNHKLKFIFGLVDLDDTRALDQGQFSKFISSFINGMAGAFGLMGNKEVLPTRRDIDNKAKRLYTRIGQIAANRLLELHTTGDDTSKAQLIAAVRHRVREQTRILAEARGEHHRSSGKKSTEFRQVLKYDILKEWCFRTFKDPLALPYALVIERFSAEQYGDVADEYDEKFSNFCLSHSGPVDGGGESESEKVDVKDLLTRSELIMARVVHDTSSNQHFSVLTMELEDQLGLHFEGPFAVKLRKAITKSEELYKSARVCSKCGSQIPRDIIFCNRCGRERDSVDFNQFLRYLCPEALPKHINMFLEWAKQYDEMFKLTNLLKHVKKIQGVYLENESKPVLPLDEIASLKNLFASISLGRGYVTKDDLMAEFGWTPAETERFLERFDIDHTGLIDQMEFLKMMCPTEYRMPEMSGPERKLFGQLVESQVEIHKQELDAKMRPWLADNWKNFIQGETTVKSLEMWQTMFAKVSSGEDVNPKAAMPDSANPEVEAAEWDHWNAMFDELDQDKDGLITSADVEYRGWLGRRLSQYVMTVIDPAKPDACTKRGLLRALLRATGTRRTGFF
mmetsp:Transcript_137232/g.256234  ORF Transcript_137232/g.256234 Transcript_137232/m.256234 type:complete len:746 (-) Transcript_137232:95-2332(-)